MISTDRIFCFHHRLNRIWAVPGKSESRDMRQCFKWNVFGIVQKLSMMHEDNPNWKTLTQHIWRSGWRSSTAVSRWRHPHFRCTLPSGWHRSSRLHFAGSSSRTPRLQAIRWAFHCSSWRHPSSNSVGRTVQNKKTLIETGNALKLPALPHSRLFNDT